MNNIISNAIGDNNLLTRYEVVDDKAKVLLIYLYLNNYDKDLIEKVIITNDEQRSGRKLQRRIGVTKEFVDIGRIEEELKRIQVPIIYSFQSFDMYSTAETIYSYTAKDKETPLYINDLGAISPSMVISRDCIISSNIIVPLENAEHKGFMYFVDYVLNGECVIGNWKITYKERNFNVYYTDDFEGEPRTELLYEGFELDQTATYKLVIYIIMKVAENLDEYTSDNFIMKTMKLKGDSN